MGFGLEPSNKGFPLYLTGWWRERPHLGKVDSTARYALIVTIETEAEDCDLYTPVVRQLATPVTVEADT